MEESKRKEADNNIELLPKKQHISFSEWSCYNDCQFKHFLTYKLKRKEEPNESLLFGSIIHLCIETILKNELVFKDYKELYKHCYETELDKYKKKDIDTKEIEGIFKSVKPRNQVIKILNTLDPIKTFLSDYEIVGVELDLYELICKIKNENNEDLDLFFKGYIDLCLKHKSEDYYLIIDYKSANKPWDISKKIKDKNFFAQVALYKFFINQKLNIPLEKIKCRYIVLSRTDEPVVQPYEVEIKDEFMFESFESVKKIIQEIYNKTDYSKLSKALEKDKSKCFFCSYKNKECNAEINQNVNYLLYKNRLKNEKK